MLNLDDLPVSTNANASGEIIEEKYLLIITRYPNGETYSKVVNLQRSFKKTGSSKKKAKKQLNIKVTEQEEETI